MRYLATGTGWTVGSENAVDGFGFTVTAVGGKRDLLGLAMTDPSGAPITQLTFTPASVLDGGIDNRK